VNPEELEPPLQAVTEAIAVNESGVEVKMAFGLLTPLIVTEGAENPELVTEICFEALAQLENMLHNSIFKVNELSALSKLDGIVITDVVVNPLVMADCKAAF
jgi:hypothetical protein